MEEILNSDILLCLHNKVNDSTSTQDYGEHFSFFCPLFFLVTIFLVSELSRHTISVFEVTLKAFYSVTKTLAFRETLCLASVK